MLRTEDGCLVVYFDQHMPRGVREIKMSLDVYLLLVAESKDLEQLRVNVFNYCERGNKIQVRVDAAVAAA